MDEQELTAAVKAHALDAGLDLVGILAVADLDALPAIWVGWTIQAHTERIRDHLPGFTSAVVVGSHVWDDLLEAAVRRGRGWHYPGYWALSARIRDVALNLERQGFRAQTRTPLISLKQAARLAGLGTYGKNALLVTPDFGPWVRLDLVLTDAPLIPDAASEEDLCGDCDACVVACPVGALTPYSVDADRCLVGVHLGPRTPDADAALLARFEPQITPGAHLMCTACQKACPLSGRRL